MLRSVPLLPLALLTLTCSLLPACDADDGTTGDGDGDGDGDAAECFMRATLEQEDGTIVDYDVGSEANQDDPDRHGLQPVFGQDLVHDLRLSWPAGLATGTYELNQADPAIGFTVITEFEADMAVGSAFPTGTITFTEIGDGLAGTVTVEPREPDGKDLFVVHATDIEFGCE